MAASEGFEARRTDELTDALATGEGVLEAMPMAPQPEAMKSQLLPYQLQVGRPALSSLLHALMVPCRVWHGWWPRKTLSSRR